jgi:hypothetical protein
MFSFAPRERAALAGLEADGERMVVQRWIELTFDHAHPEWRLHGRPSGRADPAAALRAALAEDRVDAVYHAVGHVAASILRAGGTHNWQFNAVRTYLLGSGDGSFAERLDNLCPERWHDPADPKPATVVWRSESTFPRTVAMPWSGPLPVSNADDAPVMAATQWAEDGSRFFVLRTRVPHGDPRHVGEAALRLSHEGTIAVDMARLTLREPLRLSPRLEVNGSAALESLRPPTMPRVSVQWTPCAPGWRTRRRPTCCARAARSATSKSGAALRIPG